MQDRTARDLLGGIVDRRAYPPPKAIHRANSEARFGRPHTFIHDDSSLSPKSPAGAGANRVDQLSPCTTTCRSAFISPPLDSGFEAGLVPIYPECLVRLKPQSRGRTRCSQFPILPEHLTAPLRKWQEPRYRRKQNCSPAVRRTRLQRSEHLAVESVPRHRAPAP